MALEETASQEMARVTIIMILRIGVELLFFGLLVSVG
jgi:hypothetical protein